MANIPTFGEAAKDLIEAKAPGWRSAKHRQQWRVTLETYAAPFWMLPVEEVDTAAVLAVLQPIWQTKPETAQRLRDRIEAVLDAARARGHIQRNEANPARWRGHLDKLLSTRRTYGDNWIGAPKWTERLTGATGARRNWAASMIGSKAAVSI